MHLNGGLCEVATKYLLRYNTTNTKLARILKVHICIDIRNIENERHT